jgi:RES domain-containing protein
VLTAAALDAAIEQLRSRPLRHTYFRAMPLRYSSDPLGKGRPIAAQRFNVSAGARVLYLAEDHNTCLNEILAFGWPPISTAIIPVQFDLKSVVDLQDPNVRAILQITPEELAFNFHSLPSGSAPAVTQILGERCAASRRVDGLLYESQTVPGKRALAVLEAALAGLGSSLTVYDPVNGLSDSLP